LPALRDRLLRSLGRRLELREERVSGLEHDEATEAQPCQVNH
jgi:hypothetical protein